MELTAKFWSQVQKSEGCWEWTGLLLGGYGRFAPCRGIDVRAHRWAWTEQRGPIPAGKVLCHTCDNRRCVRPDHLFVGTQSDNLLDASRKGRLPAANKTHCAQGHPLSGANLYQRADGHGRGCIECRRASVRKANRARRARGLR